MDAKHKGLRAYRHERHQKIVESFDKLASENLATPLRISDICKALAVSQRTASRAFRTIHGTTPRSHLHALQLSGVRQALLSADSASQTVTEIAARFGFRELGRFAAAYRGAFGESPSETLRRHGSPRER